VETLQAEINTMKSREFEMQKSIVKLQEVVKILLKEREKNLCGQTTVSPEEADNEVLYPKSSIPHQKRFDIKF
jgi:hypothetical protein